MKRRTLVFLSIGILLANPLAAEDFLEDLGSALSVSACDDAVRIKLSGLLDLEYYHFNQPAPGLIYTAGSDLFNPRLTLFLDAQLGPKLYGFVQARLDRGFDPSDGNAQARIDEAALRFTPWDDGRLSVQAGTFATAFGTWAPRSYSNENPFVTAPVPYENLTGMWDSEAPASAKDLRWWSHLKASPYLANEYDDKGLRNPVIWGAAYGTGLAVMGHVSGLDYNLEIKGVSLASRPENWDVVDTDFSNPTFSGRVAWHPNLMWGFGASASVGTYLQPEAAFSLPAGGNIDDYREIVFGQDLTFEWHHWQLWAEVIEARFETPVGNADTLAYYLEAKFKFSPGFFGALRFNQQLFGDIPLATGANGPWGPDLWRMDAALGWHMDEHMHLKLQYSIQREEAALHDYGHLIATQFTIRF